jgi:hypothetical protein
MKNMYEASISPITFLHHSHLYNHPATSTPSHSAAGYLRQTHRTAVIMTEGSSVYTLQSPRVHKFALDALDGTDGENDVDCKNKLDVACPKSISHRVGNHQQHRVRSRLRPREAPSSTNGIRKLIIDPMPWMDNQFMGDTELFVRYKDAEHLRIMEKLKDDVMSDLERVSCEDVLLALKALLYKRTTSGSTGTFSTLPRN